MKKPILLFPLLLLCGVLLFSGCNQGDSGKYKVTFRQDGVADIVVEISPGETPVAPTPTPVPSLWLYLTLTCLGLLVIAFGNGLFKGNLQALVGQMMKRTKGKGDPALIREILQKLV